MVFNCCVPKCDSYSTAAPGTTKISFHRFPKVTNTNSNETRENDLHKTKMDKQHSKKRLGAK